MKLDYTLRRSPKRRKLAITVERDASVIVHAPTSTPLEKIDKIVQSKRQWIHEKVNHPQKYQPRPHAPGKELVNGEAALYLGRNYRIELVEDSDTQVRFNNKFFVSRHQTAKKKQILREWYTLKAREKILPRVKQRARELGVTYAAAKIVDSRYQWGSCTPNDNVTFNWRLIKAPMFVIDYVIVHELAHFLEANHTPRFWNIVRSQMPTMAKAKTWLKENGQLLEEDI